MQANSWNWAHSAQYQGKHSRPCDEAGRKREVIDRLVDNLLEIIAPCPWPSSSGSSALFHRVQSEKRRPLYTAEERRRRDATGWTAVQGVLAPI